MLLALAECLCIVQCGEPISLLDLVFPATLEYLSCNDTILSFVTFHSYGSGWYQLTGVMHNISTLHRLVLLEPAEKAEVILRGQLEYDGKLEFATAFGYATLAAEAMAEREVVLVSGLHVQVPGAEKRRSELHLTEEMMDVLYAQDHKLVRWWDAPDVKTQFVTRGGGAPVGLSETEHVHWECPLITRCREVKTHWTMIWCKLWSSSVTIPLRSLMNTGMGKLMSFSGRWLTWNQRGLIGWTQCTRSCNQWCLFYTHL